MRPTPESDREHMAHEPECVARIRDYTQAKRALLDGSSFWPGPTWQRYSAV